jgi:hypothetical protein
MVRPQFPWPTPHDCVDERFVYTFNKFTNPVLGNTIAGLTKLQNIPLLLDPDAPFLWKGFTFYDVTVPEMYIRFKDPSGNFLSEGYVLEEHYGFLQGQGLAFAAGQGSPTPLEADAGGGQGAVFCPAGGIIEINFYNPNAGTVTPPTIILHGDKRFPKSLRRKC